MNNSAPHSPVGQRFVAWTAIIGATLAWFHVLSYMMTGGGDLEALFKPAVALSLGASAQAWFLISMLVDCFGYYLPFLAVGAYLWSQQRAAHGALADTALLCLVVYVVLGVAGAAMQIAALPPLTALHGSADPATKAASEAAWLALVHGTERGLWLLSGPVLAFWAIVTGRHLLGERRVWGKLLTACGALYAVGFVSALVGPDALTQGSQFLALLMLPLWMLLYGSGLLRRHA